MISLLAFALLLPMAPLPGLFVLGLMLASLVLLVRGTKTFYTLLRRARWLLISIMAIYAFATPGELLPQFPDAIAPTYEGLATGGLQSLRLAMMLAALAALLASTSRDAIMAGIYLMLMPLRPLGVSPDRFAARLWLTLHYVEAMPPDSFRHLKQGGWRLDALEIPGERPDRIRIEFPSFTVLDAIVLALIPLSVWAAL